MPKTFDNCFIKGKKDYYLIVVRDTDDKTVGFLNFSDIEDDLKTLAASGEVATIMGTLLQRGGTFSITFSKDIKNKYSAEVGEGNSVEYYDLQHVGTTIKISSYEIN